MPEEAAELAEVASLLIEAHPETRSAFAELAAALGAGTAGATVGDTDAVGDADAGVAAAAWRTALPLVVALARLSERLDVRAAMTLPTAERHLWQDAGASFEPRAVDQDAINAAAAFSDLVLRSIEGDGAVATLLQVDRSRISQRVRDRTLWAFSRGDTRYFPRWQFTPDGTLPGLREVATVLHEGLHPLVVDRWFNTPSVDLEIGNVPVSPVTWLKTGGNPQVVAELADDL